MASRFLMTARAATLVDMGRPRIVDTQDILDAARDLFYQRGFDAVGVDAIGARAGVAGTALYRHFSGKAELLAALFDEAMDGLILAFPGKSEDPIADLDAIVRAHVDYVLGNRELVSIFFREDRSLVEPYRRRFEVRKRAYVNRWVECLKRCFPNRDAKELTLIVYATLPMLNSAVTWPPSNLPNEEAADIVCSLVLPGLHALGSETAQVARRRSLARAGDTTTAA